MEIKTPFHTDHQLDQLAGQFDHWRHTRADPGERIPQRLWDQAVALAQVLPHTRVAKHLRLAPNALKKHMAAQHASSAATSSTPPGFVEVPPVPAMPQASPTTEIELQRSDGACLRLVCAEAPLPLVAMVRAFLETA